MSPVRKAPSGVITFGVSSAVPVALHHLRARDDDLTGLAQRRMRASSSRMVTIVEGSGNPA